MNYSISHTFLTLALLITVGCASSSGVFETGKDTYTIVETGQTHYASLGSLKSTAYQKANQFCKERGKVLQPVSTSSRPAGPSGPASFELVFRALSDQDPDYKRPILETIPDIKVQVNN